MLEVIDIPHERRPATDSTICESGAWLVQMPPRTVPISVRCNGEQGDSCDLKQDTDEAESREETQLED